MEYDIEGIYNLLAGVVRLARRDAKRDPKAAAWLDEHCPTWRRYEGPQRGMGQSVGQEQWHGRTDTTIEADGKVTRW